MPILADRALPRWTHAVPTCPEARGESVHARPNTKGGPPGTVMFDWAYTHSLTYAVPPQLTLAPQLLGGGVRRPRGFTPSLCNSRGMLE